MNYRVLFNFSAKSTATFNTHAGEVSAIVIGFTFDHSIPTASGTRKFELSKPCTAMICDLQATLVHVSDDGVTCDIKLLRCGRYYGGGKYTVFIAPLDILNEYIRSNTIHRLARDGHQYTRA